MFCKLVFKGGPSGVALQQYRMLFTSSALCQKSPPKLSVLRKKTRFPFIKCKEALEKNDQDLEKAIAWLKEQAQKEGWSKAAKLGTRPMSQGLIGLLTEANNAVLVEVNCETDFVAKNVEFQSLVQTLCKTCLTHGQNAEQNKVIWDRSAANALKAPDGERSLYDVVAMEIGKMGENMALSRAAFVRSEENEIIGKYVHRAGPAISADIGKNCMMGKYGSLVLFRQLESANKHDQEWLELTGQQLAQHVVGMNPTSVGEYEPIKSEESADDVSDESDEEKMSKKKRKKQKKAQSKTANTVEDDRMLYQEFLSDNATVRLGDFLAENGLAVEDFVRFECGEELEENPVQNEVSEEPVEEKSTSS